MQRLLGARRARVIAVVALLIGGALAWSGCRDHAIVPGAPIDVESFRQMARSSDCSDTRNRLYLIDERLVFWDRAGSCADAAYAQVLFGGSVDNRLCGNSDSIAGPQRGCSDSR